MEKIILCRTAWMKYYEGRANVDIPRSGAKYIKKHKTGGEIYNFKNKNGKFYGYFPNIGSPNLNNLGAKHDQGHINGVTVVFCATHPEERGMRVVGWYRNATLHREPQSNSFANWFHAETKSSKVLIPENDRIFRLPNTFGRSSLFYFSLHPKKKALLYELKKYIANKGKIKEVIPKQKTSKGKAYQTDIEKRLAAEIAAIELAKSHYAKRHGGANNVISVERENKGWDLEVKSAKLKIEVKGLSGPELNVDLTPNEFNAFSKHINTYQLFVVNNVLSKKPIIRVFKYQSDGKIWVANDKSILDIKIVKSARLCLK